MLESIKTAVAWLSENIDPAVPRALFVVAVLLTVLVVRKLFPRAWEAFARVVRVPVIEPAPLLLLASKTWQALPGAIIGGVTLALTTGGDVRAAVKGVALGALAALAHEVLKAVPWVPYTGAVGRLKGPPTLPVLMLFVPAVLVSTWPFLSGCGAFSKVTPGDRAEAYAAHAKSTEVVCKAYRFDLAAGLTPAVSAMAKLCAANDR